MDSMDKPGPDYVRVLAMLERKPGKQQWLVDLAYNLVNNQLPRSLLKKRDFRRNSF